MSERQKVLKEIQGRIALVTVNRPEALNALDQETLAELETVFSGLREDQSVGAVVLTGSGEKAFIAGADIRELSGLDPVAAKEFSRRGQGVMNAIESFPKPVVAAVNGFCLGGGCEVALACHLRLAGPRAKFGLPEVKLGLIPGYGGTQRLARLVGRGAAWELMLSGELISAEEGCRVGLVNRVVEHEILIEESIKVASSIIRNSPTAVRYCLEAVNSGSQMPLTEALDLESTLFGLCFATEDSEEGISAFLEKRKPDFKGK
jgi:enoyl-CoA hydratase